eukprot:13005541-Alexandrium_andersonii.AAC.1
MMLAIMTVLVSQKWAQTQSPELSRGPFDTTFRTERECGNENLPGAPEGALLRGCSRWEWR